MSNSHTFWVFWSYTDAPDADPCQMSPRESSMTQTVEPMLEGIFSVSGNTRFASCPVTGFTKHQNQLVPTISHPFLIHPVLVI